MSTSIQWEETVPGQTLLRELQDLVRHAAASAERSHQKAIGPSEVGHPCARKLAFSLMQEPKLVDDSDPLPSVTGTAVHTWFEDAVEIDNKRLGRQRWLSERKVTVRQGLRGTADLYDTDTDTVIDLKNPGAAAMTKYRKDNHPGEQYRVQLHSYGLGYQNEGYDVKRVAIFALPRAGYLSTAWLWTEDFDPAVAVAALERLDSITLVCADLDVEHHPERYQLIPATESHCDWCPWYVSDPVEGAHCCGVVGGKQPVRRPKPTSESSQRPIPPEPKPDGVCEVCRAAPGFRVVDTYQLAMGGPRVEKVMCDPCYAFNTGSI